MKTVSLFDAKTHLARLVEQISSGAETEITIARRGQPVARLVPVPRADTAKRIGVGAGQFDMPDDIDGSNQAILAITSGA